MKKKKVPEKAMLYRKKFRELSSDSLSGPLAKVISELTQLQVQAENEGFSDLIINTEADGYGDGDDYVYSCILGNRLETDAEFTARLRMEDKYNEQVKKTAETKRQQELKEYERLKKKFEKA